MNDIGLSLPDFGVLMGQQDRKPITGSDVTAPDDVIKSLLHSSAPYTDYEEATTALTELSGNIPDLAELMSSVVPDGSEQKQKMPSRNRAPDNWSEMPRTPLIPLTVEDVDASGQLWLKSECNGWQNSADCWSQNLCTQLSSENQPLRRWSSTSYPSASETYARQHPGFDDLGCAVVSEQPFMRGLAHSGAPSCIHGNGHQNDLQFAGNQQGTVNMYGKHSAIRTVEMDHTISSRQFTHGRSRSMSLADERFRYTSWPEGRSRPTVEEESMRTSDEVRLQNHVHSHACAHMHTHTRTGMHTHARSCTHRHTHAHTPRHTCTNARTPRTCIHMHRIKGNIVL